MAHAPPALPTILLAHGASGRAETMRPYAVALERRGLTAGTVELAALGRPVPKAERAVPTFIAAVPAGSVAGGHSYGGRVLRTEHWSRITCPVLLLSGESDPFGRLDLLKEAVRLLPSARLVTFPRVGHGLLPVVDEVADLIEAFARGLPAAG